MQVIFIESQYCNTEHIVQNTCKKTSRRTVFYIYDILTKQNPCLL